MIFGLSTKIVSLGRGLSQLLPKFNVLSKIPVPLVEQKAFKHKFMCGSSEYHNKYALDELQPGNVPPFQEACSQICNELIFPATHFPVSIHFKRKKMKAYKLQWDNDAHSKS